MPKDIEAVYPLSPMQESMLVHSLYAPESSEYFRQIGFRIEGALDVAAFRAAWQSVHDRHAVLRTSFLWKELKAPVQVVHASVPIRWIEEDWRDRAADDQSRRLRDFRESDRQKGFDFARAPLSRCALFRTGDRTYQFTWSCHHVLLDGWSIPIVLQQASDAYRALVSNRKIEGPARPYRDFIAWLRKQDVKGAETFWRERLEGLSLPTTIAIEQATAGPSRFGSVGATLPAGLVSAIQGFARQQRVTVGSFIQAAWGLLLARYSGEEDAVFGSVVSGRPADIAGVEQMVGLFINTLPVRASTAGSPTVGDYLKRFQSSFVDARRYEHSALVDIQRWAGAASGQGLFNSLVVVENYPVSDSLFQIGDLAVDEFTSFERSVYPLTLVALPGRQTTIQLLYDESRYAGESVERMLGHLIKVFEELTLDAGRPVTELDILTEQERELITLGWNDTSTTYPAHEGIAALFEAQVRRNPDGVAVEYDEGQLSYAELDNRANQLARYLASQGATKGALIAVCLERSAALVTTLLAVLKSGGAYVPIDPDHPAERQKFMLTDSGAGIVVTDRKNSARIPDGEWKVISLSGDAGEIHLESFDAPQPAAGGDDLAYVMYTSGSTGIPKGIRIPQRGISRLVLRTNYLSLGPSDRVAQAANASFDASTFEIWGPLLTGGTVVGLPQDTVLSSSAFEAALRARRISVLFLTTALFNQMAREAPSAFAPLRCVLFGGEAVDPAAARRVLEQGAPQTLLHVYGPTETTTFATWHPVRLEDTSKSTIPIGRPISNTTVYLLDRHRRLVPAGMVGELYIGGPGLAHGYHQRPELTAAAFLPDPFSAVPGARLYKTGDLGRCRPDGAIEFTGRVDHQIKLRGFRIELGEIETALRANRAVQEAVVLVREDTPGDKRLVGYLATGGTPISDNDLRASLKSRLPEYMVPSVFVVMEALPLTANGKIDRQALPAPGQDRPVLATDFVAPESELEKTIADLWREVLRVDQIGLHDNFFDLGGHSLLVARVFERLRQIVDRPFTIVDLFKHSTVSALAAHLAGSRPLPSQAPEPAVESLEREPVAVIGMAGRFPGAANIDELWRNVAAGVESIVEFSEDQVRKAGVPETLLADSHYVKAGTILEGAELFDAQFFGLTPREAEITDPQHRIFLECAQHALDHAGCDPATTPYRIGVYAGASLSSYLVNNLYGNPAVRDTAGGLSLLIGNDKDFLPTRVAYKLNLKGPAVNVQTACSTSLVAVHLACRALHDGECDVALAGGVSVQFPQCTGYLYQEEGIASPDGHCRPFDAHAAGTVGGNGAAIVVLKRLSAALADGDTIHAVIRGSAINNDGSNKIGYTAPSVDGQAAVIRAAQAAAGMSAGDVSYVEAHGTGTHLGDPIEISALTQAFRASTDRKQFCAIGSVKSNVGHLDSAAGVTGLIKAVLQLEHRMIAPSLHYVRPNPGIDFENSPFFVNDRLREWSCENGPRIAGVSSFGLGGTNVHVVVEEAAAAEVSTHNDDWKLLTLSAKTPSSLDALSTNLATHIQSHPEVVLGDVAHTTQVGRTAYPHRRAVLCRTREDAVRALESGDALRVWTGRAAEAVSIAFMFPGQGSQHVGMARELFEREPLFRGRLSACAERLQTLLDRDLLDVLFPDGNREAEAGEALIQTRITQPALFAVEYALAGTWMDWGVRPAAMIGHSIGEYVAACLAGVMSLEDALDLVAARAALMQEMPAGSMLAVGLSEEEALAIGSGLSLAAVNAPAMTVLSGEGAAIDAAERALVERGVETRRLRTSHAFHSSMMDPIIDRFMERVRRVPLHPPSIRYISNVSGTWITPEQATDPLYWATQLRSCVRFSQGLRELSATTGRLLLEVGPGQALSTLARRQPGTAPAYASMRAAHESRSDIECLMGAAGKLWTAGATITWHDFRQHASTSRAGRKVALPGYPFERKRYWIDPPATNTGAGVPRRADRVANWFYVPSWKRTAPTRANAMDLGKAGRWLLLADRGGVGDAMLQRLREAGCLVSTVRPGTHFERTGVSDYRVQPGSREDYAQLLRNLGDENGFPQVILHLWSMPDDADPHAGFTSLMALAQAIGGERYPGGVRICVFGTHVHDVTGGEPVIAGQATVLGACRVIPQEYSSIDCRFVDVDPETLSGGEGIDCLLAEAIGNRQHPVVAYRKGHRWQQAVDAVQASETDEIQGLREGGVYLITGGTGGIGFTLAEYLAVTLRARVALTARSFPERGNWAAWLASHSDEDLISRKISRILELETLGAKFLVVRADVSNVQEMSEAVRRTRTELGSIQGVVHAAGVPGSGLIQTKSAETFARTFVSKVNGTRVLFEALADAPPDFILLCSSLSSRVGGVGQADYCAANSYLDALAHQLAGQARPMVMAVNWDTWKDVGMAAAFADTTTLTQAQQQRLSDAMSPAEGVQAFQYLMRMRLPQVFISTVDLDDRIRQADGYQMGELDSVDRPTRAAGELHERPTLQTEYIEPRTPLQLTLAGVWKRFLGIQQIGLNDNFFELGGDSLLLIRIQTELRRTLQKDVPVAELLRCPTIGSLAASLDGPGAANETEALAEEQQEREQRAASRMESLRRQRTLRRRGPVETSTS